MDNIEVKRKELETAKRIRDNGYNCVDLDPYLCCYDCPAKCRLHSTGRDKKNKKNVDNVIKTREAELSALDSEKPAEIKPNSQITASVILSKCLEIFDGEMINEIAGIVSEFAEAYHIQNETRKPCEWNATDNDGIYKTACGLSWSCDNGTPEENKMNYCPHCGGKIIYLKEGEK